MQFELGDHNNQSILHNQSILQICQFPLSIGDN